jgi:predicted MFS family arabinose efflux permease
MPAISATISTGARTPLSTRLPLIVPVLALGVFLLNTTEFIVAGLLQEMSSDYGVGLSTTGLLITFFAVGMIVGAPMMAIATLRLPRRVTLVLALLVFAAGHVLAALTSSFEVALIARVITAFATGTFWAVASVVATTAAGPAASSRALGVMMSGVGLAAVAGVPLGSFAGQFIGWRVAFWGLAVLAVIAAAVIGRLAPPDLDRPSPSVRNELAALRTSRTWLLVAVTALVTGGYMAAFSYISPLLTERTGLPSWTVPLVLVLFGVGSLVGANLGGRLGDAHPLRTLLMSALGVIVVLLLLVVLSPVSAPTVVLVGLLGVVGMSVPPVATSLAVRYAPDAPTLAAALAVAAFNVGIALASWCAGIALDSSLATVGPSLVGAAMAALGLIPLALLARRSH